jgi:hypothetical protein
VTLRSSDLQPANDQLLEAGFHAMYGLNFEESGKMFTEYEQAHPTEPLGYAAEATSVFFGELKRLKLLEAEFEEDNKKFFAKANGVPDPKLKQRMLDLSARTQTLAEGALRRNASDEQALFALALTNGILGDYCALVEHRYWGSDARAMITPASCFKLIRSSTMPTSGRA